MNWLDIAGPPGVGKSTLCDAIWGPHAIPIENRLPPDTWLDFCNEITRLFHLIRSHPTFPAALRMVNRSVRKIATVERCGKISTKPGATVENYYWDRPYIQTALAQRGLGFGWRLMDLGADPNELRHYFRLMPVSLGVAFLEADEAAVIERNKARRLNPATAHEDRSFMVPLMKEPIAIAKEVLRERGVPVIEVDVGSQPVDAARAQLLDFADRESRNPTQVGFGGEIQTVLSPPPWWK